jgi:DNA-binding transcriptional regulator LsrR (DeoR family)
VNIGLVGIGAPVPVGSKSTILTSGYIDDEMIERLIEKNACGDIGLQFYDLKGDSTPFDFFNEKVFGISLKALRKIERVIGVCGGSDKVKAIVGAVEGKYINVLVTDYECAVEMLKY